MLKKVNGTVTHWLKVSDKETAAIISAFALLRQEGQGMDNGFVWFPRYLSFESPLI